MQARVPNRIKQKLSKISHLKQFAQHSLSRLQVYREEHERLPPISELAVLGRRALESWRTSQADYQDLLAEDGLRSLRNLPLPIDQYDAWLEVNQWNSRRESHLRARLADLSAPPLLSVVMPVYNPALEFLDRAIQTVASQVYENWELCIADDASTDPSVKTSLQRWAEREPRLRVLFREKNGNISLATNSAAAMARSEYLLFLDQDDEITPDALGEIALFLAALPKTEILYSDDDKVDRAGRRYAPQFKPDWSPELLLSYMYFSHLFVIRRDLFEQLGGLRAGFEGAQDYDLALRATEVAKQVEHIPRVLYHWRALPTSTASSGGAKPESFSAGAKALQEAFDRRQIRAQVHHPEWAAKAACGIFAHRFADDGPRVAIVIPTRNNEAVLKTCLESLRKTTYQNYEVIVVDNESDDKKTIDYLQKVPHRVLRISNLEGTFNFAAINNRAAEQIDAEYVLFLNDDTEVYSPEWLSQMVGYLGMPGVGAVGARLLFPDGRIQHAGMVHGYFNGMVGHAFKLLPNSDRGYLDYPKVTRNYSAVTAACMLTRRDLFLQLGGFDQDNFSTAFNDVDFCHRLLGAGYRTVYCPTAELLHHEGHSTGDSEDPAEPAALRKKYGKFKDPYYNPNLSLEHERFSIDARTVVPKTLEPMRVLMCTHNLNWEGAPYSQFNIAIGLKDKGIITPVIYSPQEGPLRRAYERHGIQVEVRPQPLTLPLRKRDDYERAIGEFSSWIQGLNVDVTYGNTVLTFYAIEAARQLGVPSIWNVRECDPWPIYTKYFGPYVSSRLLGCFKFPYKVVFDSNAARMMWSPLNARHNFMTIHNGLELHKFSAELLQLPKQLARRQLNIADTEVMVLIVGTVCARKGQMDLVEALGRLSDEQVEKLHCFIVGDREGDYSKQLHQAHEALSASKRAKIEIIPETQEATLYYAAADIYVGSSRRESFPRVILEAMAAELTIITTPVNGVVEQVRETNALFYEPGDIDMLVAHLNLLLGQPELRRKMATINKYMLERLISYDEMIDAYGDVFRGAWLSGTSRGGTLRGGAARVSVSSLA